MWTRDTESAAGPETATLDLVGWVVGLPGLEPGTSSLSGIEGSALCGPAFSQVAGERRGRRDAFLATSFQAVQASQTVLRASSGNSRMVEEVRRRGLTVLPVCSIAAPTAQDQPEPVAAGRLNARLAAE